MQSGRDTLVKVSKTLYEVGFEREYYGRVGIKH